MRNKTCQHLIQVTLIIVLLLLIASPVAAQKNPKSDYELTWYVVGGGAFITSGDGTYSLGATVGQTAAGALSNGDYAMQSGFWSGAADDTNLYLPLILR
jgi:hypothetical protein